MSKKESRQEYDFSFLTNKRDRQTNGKEQNQKSSVTLNQHSETKKNLPIPKKILVDEMGRILDDQGNVIQTKPSSLSTLKININKNKEARVKELLRTQKIDQYQLKQKETKYYDPTLDAIKKKKEKKKSNAFNFVEKGFYLNNKKIQTAKQLGIDLSKTQLTEEEENDLLNPELFSFSSNKRQSIKLRALDLIPEVEWWDSYFLPNGKKTFCPYKDENGILKKNVNEIRKEDFENIEFNKDKITAYVQHPVPVKNDYIEKMNKTSLPMFLTQKERKRIRKLKRLDKEKDKQEKMKLGLMEPPKPKLKFNNFVRILGEEAVNDPSRVESEVRKAYEERYERMMKENEERKLTKEQKHEKIRRKFERDIKKECRACLFRIDDLSNKKLKFKINMNAQQLFLTGICITNHKNSGLKLPSLLLVEGGPLAIKKFKNLCMRRIKWDKTIDNPNTENSEEQKKSENLENNLSQNSCTLVWEGVLKKRYFDKWKIAEIRTENEARKFLADKGIEHFWNLILTYKFDNNNHII